MIRQQRSLAGEWQFQPDPEGQIALNQLSPSRKIKVPLPWQAAFPEMQTYSGYAWYQHEFNVTTDWLKGEVLLTFGAVDYWCEVFINGAKVGEHEGGYTPFTFAIREQLREGSNQLAVRVYDPIQHGENVPRQPQFPIEPSTNQPPFGALSIPHGKQEWYINVGGIWQDVTLTAVPSTYIRDVKITPAINGTAKVVVRVAGATNGEWAANATIEWQGQAVVQFTQTANASDETTLTLQVDSPYLWSLDHPALYTLRVRVRDDEISTRFGFREIAVRDGKTYLNNEPVYILSALDQDFYLETIYTVPSEEFLRDEFKKAKELGLNCLRCHIKVPDPLYLDLADEMGLLIWAEIPSWRTFYRKGTYHPQQTSLDDAIKQRVETTLRDMIDRDFNHPSLMIWTMVNEDWGTMLPLSAEDRAWVGHLYHYCKQLDPTRLVVDNSACPTSWGPNLHVQSDFDDWHIYANIPDSARQFVNMVEQLNMRPIWTYSSFGDVTRTAQEPIIVSEFGNWGLSAVKPYFEDGTEPGWFNLGPWWSSWEGEPGWMKGVLERYVCYGLEQIFGDYEDFTKASQWHQYQALKFQIETMRRLPAIMGYVITELTDIYWECNGLMDFARRTKAYHDVFQRFNNPDVVVSQLTRYAYWDDETALLALCVSRFSQKQGWNAAKLRVQLGDKVSETEPTAIETATVRHAEPQEWSLHSVTKAEMQSFDLRVVDTQSNELAHNTADILVLPAASRKPNYTGTLAVIDHPRVTLSKTFAKDVKTVGYKTTDELSSDVKLAVTTAPTHTLVDWIRAGGDAVFICRGASPFFWAQSRGNNYGGNWMTAWSWLRPGVHRRVDYAEMNPLKLPFMNIMPLYTILGLPVEASEYQNDFLAGQFTGWINHPAVHTVQFRYGQGRVIMTTFSLADMLGVDPMATAMFHDLVEHLAEDRCQPTLRSNW